MMKKMLVLALVLAVAGLANAGMVVLPPSGPAGSAYDVASKVFTLNTTINGDTNVGIWSDKAGTKMILALGAATTALDASGFFFDVSDLIDVAGAGNGQVWTLASYGQPYPVTGALLSGSVPAGATKVYVQEFDGDGAPVGQMATYIIPEPMTMGLLALGALFLRKK